MKKFTACIFVAGLCLNGCPSADETSATDDPSGVGEDAAAAIETDGFEEPDEISGDIPPAQPNKRGVIDPGHIRVRVRFKRNSVDVGDKMPKLDHIAAFLKQNAEFALVVRGHTNSTDNPEADVETSRKRADAVAKYLQETGGIDAKRIQVEALGSSSPIAEDGDKRGRAKNRRVDFALVPVT